MEINTFYTYVELAKAEILHDANEFLKFLKTVGNNRRYRFINQLLIYDNKADATACADLKYWQDKNAEIIPGERAIPIVIKNRMGYIYDISQTTLNKNKINRYEFDAEKHSDILKNLIEKERYKPSDRVIKNIYLLTRIYSDREIEHLTERLQIKDENKKDFVKFMRESISYAVSKRLDIDFPIEKELVKRNLKTLNLKTFAYVGTLISQMNLNIIEPILKEINIFRKEEQNGRNIRTGRNVNDDRGRIGRIPERGIFRERTAKGIQPVGTTDADVQGIKKNGTGERIYTGTTKTTTGTGEITGRKSGDSAVHGGRRQIGRYDGGNSTHDGETNRTDRAVGRDTVLGGNAAGFDGIRERNGRHSGHSPMDTDDRTVFGKLSYETPARKTAESGKILSNGNGTNKEIVGGRKQGRPVLPNNDVGNAGNGGTTRGRIKENTDEKNDIPKNANEAKQISLTDVVKNNVGQHEKNSLSDINRERFAEEIEKVLNNETQIYESVLIMEHTPKILQDVGLQDLPILFSQGHIKNALHEKGKNPRWHGLTKDQLLSIPEQLTEPTAILDSFTANDSIVVVTNLEDKDKLPIIASIKAKGEGKYELDTIDSNYLTSVYGKDNFENFFAKALQTDKLLYANKEKIQALESSSNLRLVGNLSNLEFDTIIHKSQVKIKAEEKESENKKEKNIKEKVDNFKITDDILPHKLSPSERLNNNLDAISMLKRLESGERELDINAQETLARYVGWGGLSDVFDENKDGQWKVAREFLQANLSKEEYESAKQSTLTAFYTPKTVIDGIYNTLSGMGFKGGNILEPSMGIGNFIGNLPDNMKKSDIYGVELDSLSGRIAKQLYPNSNIQIKGFEETNFSNCFFDVAVGNVPFGEFKVNDAKYNRKNFLIHDYFFAKAIDKVRNGGIIAFITSSGTMDKKDESVRKYINSRAEFLGAIRLPDNTFKGTAGTHVTSDIIFLKKRDDVYERDDAWIHLDDDKNGLRYNKYFVKNPEMVIGNMEKVSGRFGETVACVFKDDDTNFKTLLSDALSNISKNYVYEEIKIDDIDDIDEDKKSFKTIPATDDVKNFSYTVIDDQIYYRQDSVFVNKDIKGKDKEKIKAYVNINSALRDVIYKQKENFSDEDIQKSQAKLNEVYDSFVTKYGRINGKGNKPLLRDDGNFPLVSSIEILDNKGEFKEKADIFFKRTIKKTHTVTHVDTSYEALILSVSQKGNVDFSYMESLTGKDRRTLIDELKGEIFLDAKNPIFNPAYEELPFDSLYKHDSSKYEYVSKDEYLSGDIREKISNVENFILKLQTQSGQTLDETDEKEKILSEIEKFCYQKNMLIEVLPKKLEAGEINVRLGATWIPPEDIKKFIIETLKPSRYAKKNINVKFFSYMNSTNWKIDGKNLDKNDLATTTYGTNKKNAYEIIENALNLKDTKVYKKITDSDGKERDVLSREETILVTQKQEMLQEEFRNWIFSDKERRERLVKVYNDRFNSIRNREYDGSNLTFDGMNTNVKLRDYQKNAIARTLYGGNTLFAHAVGAGKSYEMAASVMEGKRLGLCSKSLIVVPGHLTLQMGHEFMRLYPSANILIADKKDFEEKNRKRFVSKIATGEYDAIIIGHSQFEKIAMSKTYQKKHIENQINEILNYISEWKCDRNMSFSVKEMQKTKKSLEVKLEQLNDSSQKDDVISFEELGIDKLIVDEAHNYKNLYLYTKMKNVAGIGQVNANKSSDMFMKCRYMDEVTNGKGIIFATGTPISNSMSELYTMQRYLQYDLLRKKDMESFDSWASNFGETKTAMELSPEGTGYRLKTRFSKFYNMPELMSMFKETADIQTADMIKIPVPDAEFHVIKTMPTAEQKQILERISERADDIRNRKIDSEKDNMLKITNDGKKLALDQRLINPLLPDDENSKVNACVKKVFDIWKDTKYQKSTQIIFSDMSVPKADGEFNVYDDIRNKLVKLGIPKDEIVFIHEAKTDKQKDNLFDQVRKGDVRILMGSTQKMGAGTNVQDKLIAMHDLDVPWRPSDLEQRAGRIVRYGNENKKVDIYRYVTENTFDSYLWQILENKQKFISQIMTSKTPVRVAEDVDTVTLDYAETKALCTGNPTIKEKMILDTEITKLKILESNYKSNLYKLEDKINITYPEKILKLQQLIDAVKEDIQNIEPQNTGENKFTSITIKGKTYTNKKTAGEKILSEIRKVKIGQTKDIGTYRNFDISVKYDSFTEIHKFYLTGKTTYVGDIGLSAEGNITRFDNAISKIPETLERFKNELINTQNQLETAKKEIEKPFVYAEELRTKLLRLAELNILLDVTYKKEPGEIEEKISEVADKKSSYGDETGETRETEITKENKEIEVNKENNDVEHSDIIDNNDISVSTHFRL